jgi:tellurite resistance protein TerC
MTGADLALFGGLLVALFFFLWLDLHFFARGREPSFKEAVYWSIGWLALSLLAAIPVWLLEGSEDAVVYTTVYLIERSLSLDNLFVFILLFSYFGVPYERRPRLLFWGIVAALAMRGAFILAGSELIERFHIVIYLLGAALIVLAYRIWRGVSENVDPDKNLMVRGVRKVFPVTSEFHGGHWFVKQDGVRHATPLFLCLAAIVFADIAFAVDSIPAAFAITRDPLLIWMGNVFALLGLRALFVLVESLIARFRYLDETIAIVLGLVGVKLLIEDFVEVGPVVSLAVIAVAFAIGILLSIRADRRDPRADEKRQERVDSMKQGADEEEGDEEGADEEEGDEEGAVREGADGEEGDGKGGADGEGADRGPGAAAGGSAVADGAPAEQAGEAEQAGARHGVDGREQARTEAAAHERHQ